MNLDFKRIKRIGEGGFGKLFKAINKIDGRKYAIKVINLDSSDD